MIESILFADLTMLRKTKQAEYDLSAHLLDADGNIFNRLYLEYRNKKSYEEKNAILQANQKAIDFMAEEMKKAKEGGRIETFSIRQTLDNDEYNAGIFKTGLFCDALPVLGEALKEKTQDHCQYEKYLIGDLATPCTSVCLDSTKISMLYARMQRLAAEHAGKKVHVTVWDDSEGILKRLYAFFLSAPDLIPKEITLDFIWHDPCGDKFETFSPKELTGKGQFNPYYVGALIDFYASQQFHTFADEPHILKLEKNQDKLFNLFGEIRRLHKLALVPLAEEEWVIVEEKDSDEKADPVAEQKKAASDNLPDMFLACSQGKQSLSALTHHLLSKIQTARTPQEIRDMIALSEKHQDLWKKGHDAECTWSSLLWKKSSSPVTLNDLIVVGKCRILIMSCEQSVRLTEEDQYFLQSNRDRITFGNATSFSLLADLNTPAKQVVTLAIIKKREWEHAEAVRSRYPSSFRLVQKTIQS